MARDKTSDSDISAIRADIADLVRSVGRLESEVNETRAALRRASGKGRDRAANGNGNGHGNRDDDDGGNIADDLMAGALKIGGEAAEAAGEAVHAGASWIDDMLRKNPTPAVLAALGIGFVLGVMGRR
jgi:hypothetical protein